MPAGELLMMRRKLKMRNLGLRELRMTRQAKMRLRDGISGARMWKVGGHDLEKIKFVLIG